MAFKRLTTAEMVQISGPWVTAGNPARDAILGEKALAGLLPRLEEAHKALHDTQPGTGDPRLAALQEEEAAVDLQHDTYVRGSHMLLSALALLSPNAATGATFERLRDFLLPDGLDTTQKSYRNESGAASLLETRLAGDPSAKKQLKEIPVLKQNLGHFVTGWMTAAATLGKLEDEKALITGTTGEGARAQSARLQWIRAVNALVALADLSPLEEATDRQIFGALRLAEKAADRRARTPNEEPAAEPEAEETPAKPV